MASAEEYRDWAGQQVDRRTRDAMYEEADRIERRDAPSGVVEVRIVVER